MILYISDSLIIEINTFQELAEVIKKYPNHCFAIIDAILNHNDFLQLITSIKQVEFLADYIRDRDQYYFLFEKTMVSPYISSGFITNPGELVIGFRIFPFEEDLEIIFLNYIDKLVGIKFSREDPYNKTTLIEFCKKNVKIVSIITLCDLFYRLAKCLFANDLNGFRVIVTEFKNNKASNGIPIILALINFFHDIAANVPRINKELCLAIWEFYSYLRASVPDIDTAEKLKDKYNTPEIMHFIHRRGLSNALADLLNDYRVEINKDIYLGQNSLLAYLSSLSETKPKLFETTDQQVDFLLGHLLNLAQSDNPYDPQSSDYKEAIASLNSCIDSIFTLINTHLLRFNIISETDFAIAVCMFPNRTAEMLRDILCDNLPNASTVLNTSKLDTKIYDETTFSNFLTQALELLALYLARHRIVDVTSAVNLYGMLFVCEMSTYIRHKQFKNIALFPAKLDLILNSYLSILKPEEKLRFKFELADLIAIIVQSFNVTDLELTHIINKALSELTNRKAKPLKIALPSAAVLKRFVISAGKRDPHSPLLESSTAESLVHAVPYKDCILIAEQVPIPGDGFCLAESIGISNPIVMLAEIAGILKTKELQETTPIISYLSNSLYNDLLSETLNIDRSWFDKMTDEAGENVVEKIMKLLAACQSQLEKDLTKDSKASSDLMNYLKNPRILLYYVNYLISKDYYNTIIGELMLNYPGFKSEKIVIGIVQLNKKKKSPPTYTVILPDNVNVFQGDQKNPNIRWVLLTQGLKSHLSSHYDRLNLIEIKPAIQLAHAPGLSM